MVRCSSVRRIDVSGGLSYKLRHFELDGQSGEQSVRVNTTLDKLFATNRTLGFNTDQSCRNQRGDT